MSLEDTSVGDCRTDVEPVIGSAGVCVDFEDGDRPVDKFGRAFDVHKLEADDKSQSGDIACALMLGLWCRITVESCVAEPGVAEEHGNPDL